MGNTQGKDRAILARLGAFLLGAFFFVLGSASGYSFNGAALVGMGTALIALAIFRSFKLVPIALACGAIAQVLIAPHFATLLGK